MVIGVLFISRLSVLFSPVGIRACRTPIAMEILCNSILRGRVRKARVPCQERLLTQFVRADSYDGVALGGI
jgi:hypothetical protein